MNTGIVFMPLAIYNGSNFEEIAEGLKQKIESGEVKP